MAAPSCAPPSRFAICVVCLLFFSGRGQGQGTTATDPSEVRALSSIFDGWKISSSMSKTVWNTTGDPCSGAAVNSTTSLDKTFNPGIKCNCSFSNKSTCHITELRVSDQDNVKGDIPEDIKNFTMLTKLDLHGNYLSGPLPLFIGNMASLQHLDLSHNVLSGIIPKDLGSLENLISLDLGLNNFSGSLPEELGNLINLQNLSLSSLGLGVSGAVPSRFARLRSLKIMSISDNNFTGRLPSFIGNLTELTDLRVQGNSFMGPIPSSFADLTKLTQLRIGELLSGGSTLLFIENMKSLSTLILRNSKISGNILTLTGKYTNLRHLDLSFNNLTGQLPQSLFNLQSLEYLFLGNNSLSGPLPFQKSLKLQNMDISYNDLSGSFPSWVREANLNLNLVANNFIDNSNYSDIPSGSSLRCLQKKFPCHHDPPKYSSFAINCGGAQPIFESNEHIYEVDNVLLTTASYYVTNDVKWAVSSVGRFMDAPVNSSFYIQNIGTKFTNVPNSELYQDARLSPSSLRYYGLGLVNGSYNVKLMFGEIDSWIPSKGRRLFDIFIQGILVAEDFDISKYASDQTNYGIERNYTALVTESYLEIHFFWAGKGTCCIPLDGTYGPSILAISVTPNFQPPAPSQHVPSARKEKKTPIAGIIGAVIALVLFIFGIIVWKQKRSLGWAEDEGPELLELTIRPKTFSYAELKTATEDFSLANKLGEGGFGAVYKGVLSNGTTVAVKQLSVSSVQGKRQFITEIGTISAVQHQNLVKLYGCCCEGSKRLLIYEYLVYRSLDKILFGKDFYLDWPTRFRISLGTARGLAYLHEESSVPIIHRDVKASNILLDSDLNPKISDFGLAKLYDDKMSHVTTGVAGTVGYLAPEYAMRGWLTEKADVFGFGVVVFEILSGRRNTEPGLSVEKMYLLEWAWHLHEEKCDLEMMDPALSEYNKEEALRAIGVAFMCTRSPATRRPAMSKVIAMLVGDMDVTEVLTRPSYLMDLQYTDTTSSMTAVSQRAHAPMLSGL